MLCKFKILDKISISNNSYWKLTRRLVSSLLFLLTCLSVGFILPQNWSQNVLSLQLGPEIIRLLSGFAAVSVLGMAILFAIVVVFGRIYCSTICPLGFLQDISIWIGKIPGIKSKYEISSKKILKQVRIGILLVTVVLLIFGSAFLIGFIEPFTIFSRFLYFLKMLFNDLESLSFWSVLIILSSVLLVFIPALKFGRFFCSCICPVGTVLWGFSSVSIFRLKINQSACNHCNKCLASCKSGAISSQTNEIDQALCVGCFNCISVCNQKAIKIAPESIGTKYKAIVNQQESDPKGIAASRRKFIAQSGSFLLATAMPLNVITNWIDFKSTKDQLFPVFPLGVINIRKFLNKCTGCMLCAQKCPTGIIKPSTGSLTSSPILPILDFQHNYCLEDCISCSQICPTGALKEVFQEKKKTTKMASLELNLKDCRIVAEGLECDICAEICPVKAIEMKINSEQKIPVPSIIQDLCNGCGKCLYRCPVKSKIGIFNFYCNDLTNNVLNQQINLK